MRVALYIELGGGNRPISDQLHRNNFQKVKEGHKTNMDFPTICKKFYYCLYKNTLYVKVILLKAYFKYENTYIKNCFFKDFTGWVHLRAHVTSKQRQYETVRESSWLTGVQTVNNEAMSRWHQHRCLVVADLTSKSWAKVCKCL